MDRLNITHQAKRKGFNLIEAAIVLGVVGLVLGAIWVAASSFYESQKVNKTVEGLMFISRTTQKIFSAQHAYSITDGTIITNTLRDSGAIPKDWIKQNGKIENPYGGHVHSAIRKHDNKPRIDFCMRDIPSKSCVQILVKLTSLASASSTKSYYTGTNVSRVDVQDSDGTSLQTWSSSAFPLSMDDVSTACNSDEFLRFCIAFGLTRTN